MNHFATFDLTPTFAIDVASLSSRYRDLQTAVHPDRFVNVADAEKRIAMERAVQINEAFATLRDPVRRAMHLLSLHGINGLDANDTSMPVDFLMEQVEWREAIADARLKEDGERLEAINEELNGMSRSLGNTFAAAYAGEHFKVATTLARKMRFVQKLVEEAEAMLGEVDAL